MVEDCGEKVDEYQFLSPQCRSSSVIASGSPMWGAWPGGGMHPLRLMGANLVDQKLNSIELKRNKNMSESE